MQYALILAAMASLVAAQGVPTTLPPPSQPTGCAKSFDGNFQIGIIDASETNSKVKRQGLSPNDIPGNTLELSLADGVLSDQNGRYGYIASNGQLQFDNPIQAGAIITTGFSICPNETLALETAIWYECLTQLPDGTTFYNLYDISLGSQCSQAYIGIVPDDSSTSSSSVTAAAGASATASSTGTASARSTTSTGSGSGSSQTSSATTTTGTTGAAVSTHSTSVTSSIASRVSAATSSAATPFNPNGAPSIAISGSFLAFVAGAVGFGAILL